MSSYSETTSNFNFVQKVQRDSADNITAIANIKTKGELLVGDGNGQTSLDPSTGISGDVLVLDSTKLSGLNWTNPVNISSSGVTPGSYTLSNLTINNIGQITNATNGVININNITPTVVKGDLLVENSSVLTRLPVGTNDQVLTSDASTSTGLKWNTVDINNLDPATTKGDILVQGATVLERFGIGTGNTNKFLIADSVETTGLKYGTLEDLTPTTTTGDFLTLDDSNNLVALPLSGANNGDALTVTPTGLAWNPLDINNITTTTTKGDILVQDSNGNLVRFPSSNTDGQILTVNTSITDTCLEWKSSGGGGTVEQFTLLVQGQLSNQNLDTAPYLSDAYGGPAPWVTNLSDALVLNFPFPVLGVYSRFVVKTGAMTLPIGLLSVKGVDNVGTLIPGTDTPYNITGASNVYDGVTIYRFTDPHPANTDFSLKGERTGTGTFNSRMLFYIIH